MRQNRSAGQPIFHRKTAEDTRCYTPRVQICFSALKIFNDFNMRFFYSEYISLTSFISLPGQATELFCVIPPTMKTQN